MTNREIPTDQRRSALQRVLDSPTFRHSENLCRLLSYLGEKSLQNAAGDLKEYIIGIEAFHKPPDYDPQLDPAVRVLASKLRHKLEDYYHGEGLCDPIRIEIPKGHYELKFHPRQVEGSASDVPRLRAQVRTWRLVSLTCAGFAGALLLLTVLWRAPYPRAEPPGASRQPSWTPELELVWRPYLESSRPVLIALGTPLFTKFSGGFFRSPRINDWQAGGSVRPG